MARGFRAALAAARPAFLFLALVAAATAGRAPTADCGEPAAKTADLVPAIGAATSGTGLNGHPTARLSVSHDCVFDAGATSGGHLIVADQGTNARLTSLSTAFGQKYIATALATSVSFISLTAVGHGTDLYAAEATHNKIFKISRATGTASAFAGAGTPGGADGGSTTAEFHTPDSVAAASAEDALVVVDSGGHIMRKIAVQSSTTATIASLYGAAANSDGGAAPGTARLNAPSALDVHPVTRDRYVASTGGFCRALRRLNVATSEVETVAGHFTAGTVIDGDASAARF